MDGRGIGMTVEEICTLSSSGGALDRSITGATGRVVNAGTRWEYTAIMVGSARKLRIVVHIFLWDKGYVPACWDGDATTNMDTDVPTCTVECLMGSGEAVVIMVNPEERGNKERCVTIVPYRVQDGRKCHIVHGKLGWGIVHRCQPHGKCRAFVEY